MYASFYYAVEAWVDARRVKNWAELNQVQNALEIQQSNAVAEVKEVKEREGDWERQEEEVGHAGSIQVDCQPSLRLESQAERQEKKKGAG